MTKQERRKNIKNLSIEFDMNKVIHRIAYNKLYIYSKQYAQSKSKTLRNMILAYNSPLLEDFEQMEAQSNDKETL